MNKRTFLLLSVVCALSALGVPSARGNVRLAFDSTSLDFGMVVPGASKDLVLNVWDTSNVDIEIDQFSFGAPDAGDFSILAPSTPLVVSASAPIHTQIILQFSPKSIGIRSSELIVETSDGTVTIPVTGMGGEGTNLSWSLSSIDFGTLAPGGMLDTTVELYSNGPDTAIVAGLEMVASDTSFEAQTVSGVATPFRLAPGDSIAVDVSFRGLQLLGAKDAQLLAIGATLNTRSCDLLGNVALGLFGVAPIPVDFGTMYAGEVRDTTILLVDSSSLDLVVEDLSLDPSDDDFTIVGPQPLPFVIRAGATMPITIRANPGLTTSHVSTLNVVSQSASPNYRQDQLTVSVIPVPLSVGTAQNIEFSCAMPNALSSDTILVSNTGGPDVLVTGLQFTDSNIALLADRSFPDTIRSGRARSYIVHFDPDRASSDTLLLAVLGGRQSMIVDTVFLHSFPASVSANVVSVEQDSARGTFKIMTSAPVQAFELDTIVAHITVSNTDFATVDPASISLAPGLAGDSIVSIVPETGGYTVTIVSPSGGPASSDSSLLVLSVDKYLSTSDSAWVHVSVESPERAGCIEWVSDSMNVNNAVACGSAQLREALSSKPIILGARVLSNPAINDDAQLLIEGSDRDVVEYSVSNTLGGVQSSGSFLIEKGMNRFSLPLLASGSGMFTIRLAPSRGIPEALQVLKIR